MSVGQERRHHSVEATTLRTRERRTRLPVDQDPRLIAHHPGVVAGRNLIELAGLDQQLHTSRIRIRAPTETHRPMWWYWHSSVRAIGLIDSLQRQPLEDRAADTDIAHVVRLEVAVGDLADIVRLAEGPPLELYHRHRTSAFTSAYDAWPSSMPSPLFIASDPRLAKFALQECRSSATTSRARWVRPSPPRSPNCSRTVGYGRKRTYQLNFRGNMNFQNMLERSRCTPKKISKTQATTSQDP